LLQEGLSHRALYGGERLLLLAEAHLGLGGVHVHVYLLARKAEVDYGDGVATRWHQAGIGFLYGEGQPSV